MNIVILTGQLSSAPRQLELPSGAARCTLELSCPAADGRTLGVPISWDRVAPLDWDAGTRLAVAGVVRRRFFRAGGITQSRTEVEAVAVVEVTARRPERRALAQVIAGLDADAWRAACDAA